MKMLPQRSFKMLPKLFEDILRCPRIREKSVRKFDGHNLNINFEMSKLVRLGLIFWIWCTILGSERVHFKEKLNKFRFF